MVVNVGVLKVAPPEIQQGLRIDDFQLPIRQRVQNGQLKIDNCHFFRMGL